MLSLHRTSSEPLTLSHIAEFLGSGIGFSVFESNQYQVPLCFLSAVAWSLSRTATVLQSGGSVLSNHSALFDWALLRLAMHISFCLFLVYQCDRHISSWSSFVM